MADSLDRSSLAIAASCALLGEVKGKEDIRILCGRAEEAQEPDAPLPPRLFGHGTACGQPSVEDGEEKESNASADHGAWGAGCPPLEPKGVAEGCKVEKGGHHHAGVGAEARAHAHARHVLGADKWKEEDGEEDGEGVCGHSQSTLASSWESLNNILSVTLSHVTLSLT